VLVLNQQYQIFEFRKREQLLKKGCAMENDIEIQKFVRQ